MARKPKTAQPKGDAAAKVKAKKNPPAKAKSTVKTAKKTCPAKRGGARKGAGRNTAYRADNARLAKDLTARGFSQYQVADALGISIVTLRNWRALRPAFDAAFSLTDEERTARIKRSMAERAEGYTIRVKKLFIYQGKVIEHEVDEYVPGCPAMTKFWLTNKCPDEFADRKELTGKDGTPLVPVLNVTYGTAGHRPQPA